MSDWKKIALTWTTSTLVGFYTVFVLMQLWNWFAVPLLRVPEASYWLIYGVSMLFGLMTGAAEPDNPVHERRWNVLFVVLNACIPDHKMEDLKVEVGSEAEVYGRMLAG